MTPASKIIGLAIAIQTLLLASAPFAFAHFNISLYPDRAVSCSDTLELGSRGKNTNPDGYPKPSSLVKTVVIDPGHGGHDPGCLGSSVYEKEIALGIAQKFAAYMKGQFPEVQVILTRNTDEFIPLHERAQIANRNAADLFVSIHCNFISKASHVKGSETYVLGPHKMEENLQVALRENSVVLKEENYETIYGYDPNSPEAHIIMSMYQNAYLESSILFAGQVEKHMEESASRHSRGVKQAGFLVLRETAMPSVLIETGFLSNRQEEDYLRTPEGQYEIARALLAAFSDYKAELEGGPAQPIAATLPPEKEPEPDPPSTPAAQVVAQTPATTPPPPSQTVPKEYGSNGNTPITPPQAQENTRGPYKGIVFKVQLAAASNPIDMQSGLWPRLLYPVDVVNEGGMNKYQITASSGYWQAEEIRKQVRDLGFADAFVVVYQYGKRIGLDDAKRQLGIR